MKHFNKITFILLFFCLTGFILPQGMKQIDHNLYVESDIIDSNGVIYAKVISGKFKENVLNTNKNIVPLTNISGKYPEIKTTFLNLRNKYGDFKILKKIPTAFWGDTIRINKRTGETVIVPDMSQLFTLIFDKFIPVDSIILEMSKINLIKYVKGPTIIQMFAVPNDPFYSNQWNLSSVNSGKAWDISKGVSNITIAIVDEGIFANHPDLQNKIVGSSGTVEYNQHGTLVSGVVAASTNNQIGIASLGWNLTLYDYDMDGISPESAIYDAVNTSDVINMSWGTFRTANTDDMPLECYDPSKWAPWAKVPYPDPSISDAINYATAQGVICVASAGNTSVNDNPFTGVPPECDPAPIPFNNYPAAFDNVIAVSATKLYNSTEVFVDGWNYSPGNWMDVSAPGYNILTTDDQGGYSYWSGTSFSTPLTSALCGLILSINNSLTVNQVYNILINSTDKIGQYSYDVNGWNCYMGYGRINAYKALKYTLENYGGTITQNLTIPSGETWNFAPGVTVKLDSSLLVYGILNAVGTPTNKITFTSQSGTTNSSWGTITLNGSGTSGSIIKYANIKYGTKVEAINTSNITIQYCNIDTTYDGIRFNNSTGSILNNTITTNSIGHGIIVEGGSSATVMDNIVTKSNRRGVGIFFGGGGGGRVAKNDIYGWDWGICAIWGSSPTSYSSEVMQKNNRVRNCNTGFMVYRLSYPAFGYPSGIEYYSLNSLSNNTYNARVGTSSPEFESRLYAYSNWWGSDPPNTSLFQVGYSSQFYYIPYIYYDPWSGVPKISISSNNQTNLNKINQIPAVNINSLLEGIELRLQNKLIDAKNFFITYLANNPANQQAYVELYNCYSKETSDEIIKFFSSLPDKAAKDHKLLLSYLHLKNGDYKKALEVNNSVIKADPNSSLAARAKLNNAYIALYNENNISEAIKVFNEVAGKIELSNLMELYLVRDAIETYGKTCGLEVKGLSALPDFETTEEKLNKQEVLEIPDQYALLGNYPNPFNPSTTISYALPYQSSVELIIYDLMGREVKSFNVSSESAGYNKLVWDGRNENGNFVSSGVYFYRISIKSLENNEAFIKTAKLMMMK